MEIKEVLEYSRSLGLDNVVFDPSLARGLSYYTGTVFEVYLTNKKILSSAITGGGRFDNMIGNFMDSKEEVPALS